MIYMKKYYALLISLFSLTFSMAQSAPLADNGLIAGEILLKLKPQIVAVDFEESFGRNYALRHVRQLGHRLNIHLYNFDANANGQALLDQLRKHPMVESAQFNYSVNSRNDPNDPNFSEQWGLERIGAPQVWDVTTGGLSARGDTIVLAILDSGFDVNHEDLRDNVWFNRFEIPNNGIDDDGNGYTDDVMGWNFITDSAVITSDAHGTSVAGIAGARGNNGVGISGMNWNIKLMLLPTDNVGQVIEAYEYIIEQRDLFNSTNGQKGAFVVATNASFGREAEFCSAQPVWGPLYDEMGQVGVLTGAGTANRAWDVDMVGDMPTTCPSNFIITTLNTADNDRRYQGSAFGKVSIDLGTPGDGSFSIKPNGEYGIFGGNSASAPHLSGAIALLYSLPCEGLAEDALLRPAETALFIRQALLQSVDPIASLANETVTGGRLNVFRAMEHIQESCGNTTGDLAIVNLFPNPVSLDLKLEYESPDFEALDIRVFNALGQLVFSDRFFPARFGAKQYVIDVRSWATGTYFATINRGKDVVVRKVNVF